MRIGLLTPAIGSRNSGDSMIEAAVRRLVPAEQFVRFGIRERLSGSDVAALNDLDAALLCGSNLYQDRPQCALDEAFVNELKIPLIPLGVGVSAPTGTLPSVGDELAGTIRALHSRCDASSVRDPATLAFVEKLGIGNARLTGCPVLFHGLTRPELQFGDGSPTLSLRQTFLHGAEPLEGRQDPLLEAMCRQHQPVLVCQSPADLPQARRLAARHGLQICYDDEWQCDIHEWLAPRQSWTGGFRLHHGMLALSHGRPAWFVSHDSRVDEFVRMMGLQAGDIRDTSKEDLSNWGGPDSLDEFAGVPERWNSLAAEMETVLKANGLPCALGEKPRSTSKVLFMVPRRDWAYDFSAKSIQQRMEPTVDVRIRYSTDAPRLRPEPYDLAVVFYWAEDAHACRGFDPNRVIKVVSSHRWEFPGKHGPFSAADFARKHLADAATVWTTSRRLFEKLHDLLPRVRHLPNGYETEAFHPLQERTGSLRIGAAGWSKDEVKGYRDVLFPAVEGFDFKLADGSFPHREMNTFYNSIDVLAVTSAHEGEPLTLIESMAAGCFPVCTDVGIVPELIRHKENGFIVRDRSVQAFRDAFEWCRENLDHVRAAGATNARSMPGLRSWDETITGFVDQIQETLAFANQPRFVVLNRATPDSDAVKRLRGVLAWFRQSLQESGDVGSDGSAIPLAEDVRACWNRKERWQIQPGRTYVIGLAGSEPEHLSWAELRRALSQALLPELVARFPRLRRIRRAIQRRLGSSGGGK